MSKLLCLVLILALGACAGLRRAPPAPGATRDQVLALWGKPTAIYPAPAGEVLEYAYGPMGQETWMARLGPDGRLLTFEQVLTSDHFGKLTIGKDDRQAVLRAVGRPAERSRVAMDKLEVWSYRYRESGVWNSMMHVHFNDNGIVTKMLNGPDPMYESKDSNE